MSTTSLPDRLGSLLEECASEHGLDLEEVTLTPAGKRRVLRVAVDRDGGVTLDDVADVTRTISTELDSTEVMGQRAYTLEVSSRGTDSPLTLPRHWRRNADRLVKITLADGESLEARIRTNTDDTVSVETGSGPREIPLGDIAKARVQVELNRKDA